MFKSTYNRGFMLKFSNRFSISVQFNIKGEMNASVEQPIVESNLATITIYDPEGKAVVFEDHAAIDRQDTDAVAHWIHRVSEAKKVIDVIKHVIPIKEEDWE